MPRAAQPAAAEAEVDLGEFPCQRRRDAAEAVDVRDAAVVLGPAFPVAFATKPEEAFLAPATALSCWSAFVMFTLLSRQSGLSRDARLTTRSTASVRCSRASCAGGGIAPALPVSGT